MDESYILGQATDGSYDNDYETGYVRREIAFNRHGWMPNDLTNAIGMMGCQQQC